MSDKIPYTSEPDPFVAMPDWVISHSGLTTSDKIVYAALKHFWNRRTGQCNPAHRTLADFAKVSPRTVRGSLRHLETVGLILVTANWKGGRQSNQYHLRGWQELSTDTARQEMPSGGTARQGMHDRAAGGAAPGAAGGAHYLEDDLNKNESAHARNEETGTEPGHWHLIHEGLCRRTGCGYEEDTA